MLGRGKDILDKNNDALTSLVKTGGCVEVTVAVSSVARGKSTSMGTGLGTRASTKETAATGKSEKNETGSKL